MTHWLTRYDPDDGEPYGTGCDCVLGADHDGDGNPMDPDAALDADRLAAEGITGLQWDNLGHGAPTSAG